MSRRTNTAALLLALFTAACGGGGDDTADPPGTTAPPQAAPGASQAQGCAVRPLTFSETAWEAAPSPPAVGPAPGAVLWQASYTFTNPNSVDVRLANGVVVLEVLSSDGHHAGTARTQFVERADAVIPAGRPLERVAQAWMKDSKIPETTQVYASTSASVSGAQCIVPVERVSTAPPSQQLFTLADCATTAC